MPDALLTKSLAFRKRAAAELLASTVSGTIAVMLAWLGYGVWSIGWQIVLASGLRMVLLWMFAAWKPSGRFTLTAFRRLFGFGGFMLSARLLDTLSNRAQLLLLGWLFNASTLGFYTLAQNAQQAPTDLMGAVLSRVGLPVFSEISGHPGKLRKALQFTLRASLFLFLPCMIGLSLLAKPAIQIVYGERWNICSTHHGPAGTGICSLAGPRPESRCIDLAGSCRQIPAPGNRQEGRDTLLGHSDQSMGSGSPWHGPFWLAASLVLSLIRTTPGTCSAMVCAPEIFDQRLTLLLCAIAAAAGWTILHWTRASLWHTLSAIAAAAAIYIGGDSCFATRHLTTSWKSAAPCSSLGETTAWGVVHDPPRRCD